MVYQCKFCFKKFNKKSEFMFHEVNSHGGEKKFKCFECGKPFSKEYSLTQHFLKYHVNHLTPVGILFARHQCSFCKTYFPNKQEVFIHLSWYKERNKSCKDELSKVISNKIKHE